MGKEQKLFNNTQSNVAAVKTIIIYMIVGGLWIIFSDSLLWKFFPDPAIITKYQTIKGWFFIFSTSAMLYFLIHRYSKTIQSTTLEKKALVKLLDNFAKFANDIIILLNENGKIVEVNDRALETYGYTREEILKLECKNICGDECEILNHVGKGEIGEKNNKLFETTHIRKDGSSLNVEVSSRLIKIDGEIFYQNIIRDITERKKAEQALQESQLSFKELVDLLPQNVFEVDLNGVLKFGNRAGFEMFGYSPDDLKNNLSVFDMIVPEDRERSKQNFMAMLKGSQRGSNEYTAITKDGKKFPIMIFATPIIRSGNLVGARGILVNITPQKQVEKALRNSEERYRQLVESSPDAVALHVDGKIIFVNAAAVTLMAAKSKDQLIGMDVIGFVHPDDRGLALHRIKNMISMNEPENLTEEKFIRLDGSTIFVEVVATPILYQEKTAIQVIIRDITWRKNAEIALRNSEEKYHKLVETARDAIFIADADTGIIIDANLQAEKLIGKTKNEIIGMHHSHLHPSSDHEKYQQIFKKVALGEMKPYDEEIYVIHKDGHSIPVEISSNQFMLGDKKVIQGIFRDVSERYQAEEQIRILSRAVEQSPDSIVITDTAGNIEYVNPKFSQLTGYAIEEVIGKNPRVLKSGEAPREVYERLWKNITTGNEWHGEFHNRKKNGELYWESASITPIRDSKNNITHFLAVKEDITVKKQMTRELIEAKEKAEESDRLKSQFLAQMSHEIRTPLNIILSYGSLLREELENKFDNSYTKIFNSIDSASKRLLRTIDLILNMAAIQTGNFKPRFTKVNLVEIIKNLLFEFKNTADLKNLSLDFNPNNSKPGIVTDEYIITEILQNLIDNAIKYTHKGKVEIKIREDDENIIIEIEDTGIGISKEYLPKLFNPFSQEEMGYSRKFEGNGLGLALVKNYCDLIGATINVKSEKGKGSAFNVVLNKN